VVYRGVPGGVYMEGYTRAVHPSVLFSKTKPLAAVFSQPDEKSDFRTRNGFPDEKR